MIMIEAQAAVKDVLRAFQQDAPYLFLGAAFATVGIVSIAFCAVRRRFDPLLVWMAIFAGLYGLQLWLSAHILRIGPQTGVLLNHLRPAIDYLVPIPAFRFFQAAGFLKQTRLGLAIQAVFLCLFLGALVFGPLQLFSVIGGVVVSGGLWLLFARSLGKKKKDRDFIVVRAGLLCFVALALLDSVVFVDWMPKSEPYGFAILLGCLGYVSARRILEHDVELSEIQKELELARSIQLSILPAAFPDSKHFRVAARYVPMTSVAGDLYDFLVAGDDEAGLLIADVSGHGVPAALIASMVKMAAISQRPNAANPAQLLTGMNAALCGNTQGQFVTAAYAYLDARAGELRYAAAGHPAMLLLRDGNVTEVVENGMILAALDGASYTQAVLQLRPGDRLMLYTDGLLEARDAEGALFGGDLLSAALRRTAGASPSGAADGLIAQVQAWARSQDDDLTVLICDYLDAS
jgi:sigma-B regulation protein RsbU (phosphoserine phosphatase)